MTAHYEDLGEILDSIDMESWLDREGVRYRKTHGSSGAQLQIKECPVCGNSHYKVYINAETGLGNCFAGSCEAKFNRYKFIQASLGVSHRETIEHLKAVAREQGWRPPRRKEVATVLTTAELTLPESIALPHGGRNLRYLDNRNITSAIAQYFDLRFSHVGKFHYIGEDGLPRTQDYANRIIIPIFDLDATLVSFQGRDVTGRADKKYLFPPGFAATGTHLYNGHNAIGAASICIGEGVFDVAALKIALDQDAALRDVIPVGTFGKHLSSGDGESQLAKIMLLKEKGLKSVTFLWDGEDRAIDDAINAALALHGMGLVARVGVLPEGKDPNEVAPDGVRRAFYEARVINPMTAIQLRMRKRAQASS